MSDLISRQAAIDAVLKLIEARRRWNSDARGEISGLDAAMCEINNLPSAQDEAKPIEYRDCANAKTASGVERLVGISSVP